MKPKLAHKYLWITNPTESVMSNSSEKKIDFF